MAKRKKKGLLKWVQALRDWDTAQIEKANKRARIRKARKERRARAQFERAGHQMERKGVMTGAQVRAADDEHEWDWALPTPGLRQPAVPTAVRTRYKDHDSYKVNGKDANEAEYYRALEHKYGTERDWASTDEGIAGWQHGDGSAPIRPRVQPRVQAKTSKRTQSASAHIKMRCGANTRAGKPCRQPITSETDTCAAGHKPRKGGMRG